MKKIKRALYIGLLSMGLFLVGTSFASAEVIKEFDAKITVAPDASITVTEKIMYDFEGESRHGIFRTIPLANVGGERLEVEVLSVIDESGNSYTTSVDTAGDELSIRIGDPDIFISGVHTYNIMYRVLGVIRYFEAYDEIYWNVTGTGWAVPIEKATASIVLPDTVIPTQQSCYYGIAGSTTLCKNDASKLLFSSPKTLNPGEGLTVAVGFPKGNVAVYTPVVHEWKFAASAKTLWPILIPLVIGMYMYMRWKKKGKDAKGTGVIIAQYDAPDGLTPLEIGGIIKNGVQITHIPSEIIYLATKGYIKIGYLEKKKMFSSSDYELTLLKDPHDLPNEFDTEILSGIFGESKVLGTVVRMSSLQNTFYMKLLPILDKARMALLEKQYFSNLPKGLTKFLPLVWYVLANFALFVIGFIWVAKSASGIGSFVIVFLISSFIGFVALIIFIILMPAKTAKGVQAYEHALGLKEYLRIAEKDRLKFHNAPEKKPETFEMLLPYAILFGVEDSWAKEFEGIYTVPPSWYTGSSGAFNASVFAHQMSSLNSYALSNLAHAPGGSGSSGGGFSGGGSGGGGGGSW